MKSLFKRFFIFALLVAVPVGLNAGVPEAAKAVLERGGKSVVSIQFVLDISMGAQEQSQDGSCLGTIIDPSGIVFVANSAVSPSHPNPQVNIKTRDFKVVVDGETFEAKLIYKDSEKDYAFLRLGDPDDPDTEKPAAFPAVKFQSKALKLGESLFSIGRFGEREDYAPLVYPYFVSSVVKTPKEFCLPTSLQGFLRGTPAFSADGTAVALLVNETSTTATGRTRANNRLIIKSVDDLAEVMKKLPAPGEEPKGDEDEDEEEEEIVGEEEGDDDEEMEDEEEEDDE